jgi:MYXO-CTERM domain-containing protein
MILLAFAAFVVSKPAASQAQFVVDPGFDLWTTDPGQTNFFFNGTPFPPGPPVAFQGVPLGTFDFGGAVGVQNVGNTDTIVQRLAPAVAGGPGQTASIDIELVALQLRSVAPITVGPDTDFYYITLNQSQPALSRMDVMFNDANGGNFDFGIDTVGIDIRKGAIDGPILFSDDRLVFNMDPIPWLRDPILSSIQIEGVNKHLKGDMTPDHDIWAVSGSTLLNASSTKGPGQIGLTTAAVPEPSSVLLAALAVLGLLGFGRRRRMARPIKNVPLGLTRNGLEMINLSHERRNASYHGFSSARG